MWNTTTMTQHWNTSGLEELCLPTKLVHILYFCCVFSLIKHSFQISSKLRYIRIKESVYSIIFRFFWIKGALNFFFIGTCHWFFPLSDFSGEIIDSFLHVCSIKVLLCGHQNSFLDQFSKTFLIRILSYFRESVHFIFKYSLFYFFITVRN